MMWRWVFATVIVASCVLPFARAQYGRGGGRDPRGYGGGGGAGYGGSAYGQQQGAANAVARPGGDASLDDSVRLFLQLDQDGTASPPFSHILAKFHTHGLVQEHNASVLACAYALLLS
jgi:hypothetical protein